MKKYAITDIGKTRESNQDQAFVYTNTNGITIGIICDGMGGHKAGAYASLLAAKTVLDCFIDAEDFEDDNQAKKWLENTLYKANEAVKTKSDEEEKFRGMGTTLVVTLVLKDKIMIANVGDSRVYFYKDDEIMQVTEDQTLVNILVKNGQISEEEAINHPKKNVIMYAIGTMDHPEIDFYEFEREKMSILMCSDGIYNLINTNYLKTIMASSLPISKKAITIINEANNNGGYDNMSIVLMEVD